MTDTEHPSASAQILDNVPILTLRETVVFPLTTVPLAVGRERSVRLIEDAVQQNALIGLVAQRRADIEVATPADLHAVGTLARIRRVMRAPDGTQQVWVQGIERIRPIEYVQTEPYLRARVQTLPDLDDESLEVLALRRSVVELFRRLVAVSPYLPDELAERAATLDDGRTLYYFIASSLHVALDQRQELLEANSLREKLEKLAAILNREIDLLELGHKLQSEVRERIDKSQREYFLREQLKAIQKELGEEDPAQAEIRELREKVEQANMPEEARKEAERELARLARLPTASPEHSVIRTYLDWLTSMPWGRYTGGEIDVARTRAVLDEDHFDLEKPKERILEYLAVKKLRQARLAEASGAEGTGPTPGRDGQGETVPDTATPRADELREPILCFVGPPGVGKTSLAQSIARALGRKFVRMSLGGVRDEAEIRGHRRTYIGALPGRIIQAIRRAEAADPVFVLDEIDKVGADWRGDPSSALLEVLDPEQNKDFRDHYLDVPFDLSRVMFITTANQAETIHPALADRMEIIRLPGYTEYEKLGIARKYLLPKQLKAHALKLEELTISDEVLSLVIRDYTREAGVRNLEREIATICRKAAREIAEGKATRVEVTPEKIRQYLGRQRFFAEAAERIDRPGVATGLVVTAVGGDIVFVEANVVPGKKELRITGQLGDVMKESAEAALSYVRSKAAELGIDPRFFEQHDIHIHVPTGAVPKDGPSAGITIATALASVLTGRPVRDDVAMTGEITLRGRVLPIGGVKEKALGAHRAGIKTVILPKRNEGDLEELPEELKRELTFIPVETVDEVLRVALAAKPTEDGRVEAPETQPAAATVG